MDSPGGIVLSLVALSLEGNRLSKVFSLALSVADFLVIYLSYYLGILPYLLW